MAHKVTKFDAINPDDTFSVDGIENRTFAIASSKKELKQLMKSDAGLVYDQSKGKLFHNENGTAKGWGKKHDGGLLAKFKGNPELSADNFDDVTAYGGDAVTGDSDIKDQITSLGEEIGDEKMSELYGEILINPKKGLKRISKTAKKEGYSFDKDELGAALDEMNQSGAFINVEVDDASLDALLGTGNEDVIGGRLGSTGS